MSERAKFSLFKRSTGKYYILFEENGKRRWKSTGATTKSEALKALTSFEDLMRRKTSVVLLSQFRDQLLAYIRGAYSKRSGIIYTSTFRYFLGCVHDLPISELTQKHMDDYKIHRLQKVKPVTLNIEIRTLKAAMNIALRWEMIAANPFAKSRQVRVEDTAPAYLSKQDFQTLLIAIKEEWLREIVIFAVLTGLRRGEIINLRWENVNLQSKLINIQSSGTFFTKQGKRRTIPMNDVLFHLLSVKAVRATCEYIFNLRGKRINPEHASKKLKQYLTDIGLNENLHFHSLRHTFASWLVQDGESLYIVQKLLGHSSLRVTEKYSHLQSSHLQDAVNKIHISLN
jgi:integrase